PVAAPAERLVVPRPHSPSFSVGRTRSWSVLRRPRPADKRLGHPLARAPANKELGESGAPAPPMGWRRAGRELIEDREIVGQGFRPSSRATAARRSSRWVA